MIACTLRGTGATAPPSRHGVEPAAEIGDGPSHCRPSHRTPEPRRRAPEPPPPGPPCSPALRRTPPALHRSAGATPSAPDLDRLLAPPPASASSPATPPGLAPPHMNCIEGEKRGRERERKRREERSCWKRKKGRGEKKEEKKRKTKEKINYLFVENIISKLYCLFLFDKENKK
jgi:hypothetical protein